MTGTAETASVSSPAATGTPAPVTATSLHAIAGAPQTDEIPETLTIAGLCALLRALDDPDAYIDGVCKVRVLDLEFAAPNGRTTQHDKWGERLYTEDLEPDDIAGHSAVSFAGAKLRASVLLDVLEPCAAAHGSVRVCMDGRRALAARPFGTVTALTVPVDGLLFGNDPRAAADLAKQKDAVRLAETLVASGKVGPQVIAAVASALMPAQWAETRYYLDGTLLASIADRLPGIAAEKESARLFDHVGPTEQEAAEAKHGRFVILVPIAGLTYAALVETYGPKGARLSDVDRLIAAAAANVAADKTGKTSA
nr:hypothetical protein [Pandoravirus belohorizontensis]